MRPLNDEFGAAVTRVVKEEHGLSQVGAGYRTGIDRFTMGQMMKGYVPRMERVIQFAEGFGLDVQEWLARAGYDPLPASSADGAEPNPAEIIHAGLNELAREFGTIPLSWDAKRFATLTADEARELLADIRAQEVERKARGEGKG